MRANTYPFGTVIEHPEFRGTVLLVLGATRINDFPALATIVLADADDDRPWDLGSFQVVAAGGWIVLEWPDET